jgi:hypothetical protein
MDERKYKQRGYMEEYKEEPRKDRQQRPSSKHSGMKRYGMRDGGTARSGIRCARCGKVRSVIADAVEFSSTCENCSADLHTCTNCAFFKTSARWECSKPISARFSPKDTRNDCTFFGPAVFVERTFEANSTPQDARKAFDALFKK